MRIPSRVTHEITQDKVITKIFDQNEKLIGKLAHARTDYGFTRKTKAFEKKYPEFLSEVDGFHCTSVADQLLSLAFDDHPDLYPEWE